MSDSIPPDEATAAKESTPSGKPRRGAFSSAMSEPLPNHSPNDGPEAKPTNNAPSAATEAKPNSPQAKPTNNAPSTATEANPKSPPSAVTTTGGEGKDNLSLLLERAGSRKVSWKGHTVYSFVRLSVKGGDRLQLRRLGCSTVRAQALKLSLDRGELAANGVHNSTIAVWSHTAPSTVEIEILDKRARSIDVWNAWSFGGVDSSWVGNAGMVVQSEGQTHLIRCSDGIGGVSFDALVVELTLVQ